MKEQLCHEVLDIVPQWPIRLTQTGRDRFTVQSGKQFKRGLTYADAAAEYGRAIMHALACENRLDNRKRRED